MTTANRDAAIRSTTIKAVLFVTFMGAMSFAAVPLYDIFCRVTGFGGTPQTADAAPAEVSDQTITVRFDANTNRDLPWTFEAVQKKMDIRIGEMGMAYYRATNNSDKPVTGTASYNVAPYEVGGYFSKIDCFCFVEQTLQPGESMDMPVTFFVDPEILQDRERRETQTITLSYTFFRQEEQASLLDQ